MTKHPHTAGPWHMSEQTERDGLPSILIHGMPEGMLAIVRVGHQGGYYGDANARLIAAAPDLLEMAKWAEAAIAPFSKDPAEKSGIARLRAAIAKAEGRS